MSAFEVSTVLADAVVRLRAAGVESPRREARLLLAHVLGVQVLDIVAGRSREINEGARAHFEAALKRRVSREPLAYIVGRREFWSLEFAVAPSVLIPRPESEILVEEGLRRFPDREAPLRVADLGTGSGCLLLAFLSERPLRRAQGSMPPKRHWSSPHATRGRLACCRGWNSCAGTGRRLWLAVSIQFS